MHDIMYNTAYECSICDCSDIFCLEILIASEMLATLLNELLWDKD